MRYCMLWKYFYLVESREVTLPKYLLFIHRHNWWCKFNSCVVSRMAYAKLNIFYPKETHESHANVNFWGWIFLIWFERLFSFGFEFRFVNFKTVIWRRWNYHFMFWFCEIGQSENYFCWQHSYCYIWHKRHLKFLYNLSKMLYREKNLHLESKNYNYT